MQDSSINTENITVSNALTMGSAATATIPTVTATTLTATTETVTNETVTNSTINTLLNLVGILQLSASSVVAVVTGGIIATSTVISRTAPVGAVTGMIMAAGTKNGQICIVTNENVASTANTITFSSTISTAKVINDGTNAQVILCGTAKAFIWLTSLNSGNGAWVALAPFAG